MKLCYDVELKRPGCVLLQAALGGDPELAKRFPTESWLLAPTDDLKLYEVSPDVVDRLIALAQERSR